MLNLIDEKQKGTPKVELTLVLGDLKFTASGTFPEAIQKIYGDSFGKVKTWGTIKIKQGKKKAEIKYRPLWIRRAFTNKFARNLLYERLLLLMK